MNFSGTIPLDGTALSQQNSLMESVLNSGTSALDSYVGITGMPNAIQGAFTLEVPLSTSTTNLESDFGESVIGLGLTTVSNLASIDSSNVDPLTGLAEGVAPAFDVSSLKDGEFTAKATSDLPQPPSTALNEYGSISVPIQVGIADIGIKVVELNQSFAQTVLEPTSKAKATTAEVPTILADSDPLTGDITTVNVATTLNSAVATAKEQLKLFVGESEFLDKMKLAFGDDWQPQQANALIQDLVSGKDMPEIKILPFAQLNANGAFGAGTIYLSEKFLNENVANPKAVAAVLLEETGHFIDQKLNRVDSPGDEGDIFARLVQDQTISGAALEVLKAEDDSGTIFLNGQTITVELAAPPYPGHLLKYSPGASLTYDPDVKQWQQRMKDRGWNIDVDGFYGEQSEKITRQFQKEKGLTVDGIVDPQTWAEAFRTDNVTPSDGSLPINPGEMPPPVTPGSGKNINPAGLNLVEEFEGYAKKLEDGSDRVMAYRDSVGVLTIGFGHTGPDVTAGKIISRAEAEQLLKEDLKEAEAGVNRLVTAALNDNQFSALVSFVFNLGAGALEKSTLLTLLNQSQYQEAADQFLRFDKAGGEQLAGLTRRREAERKLFLS